MERPPHYLVVDLEATCDRDHAIPRDQTEIIEIGAVLVHGRTLDPLREFQTFVRPGIHPRLTAFCTELTGITQAQVDPAPRFPEAMRALGTWLGDTVALLSSWGDYDLNQLRRDAARHRVVLPLRAVPGFGAHLNLKTAFGARFGRPSGMGVSAALGRVGLRFEGSAHRGIDDARNIARLLPWAIGAVESGPIRR